METRIVLGISGGIAAYKIPHLVRLLRKNGATVKTVITRHAVKFVGIEALKTVSGFPVYDDESSQYDIDHIRLTQWADTLLIAPATANTIAKIALGIADNLLTSLALAISPSKIIIAPAMNTSMWENVATKKNIDTITNRGITVLPVGYGDLACGNEGAGRMLEPEDLAQRALICSMRDKPLSGKRILISSGPTEEPIDPVRVITNQSSGKMGAALAQIAVEMGADVTVISGPTSTQLPSKATTEYVRTSAEMETAIIRNFNSTDICIMAAAISDYRPESISLKKIHRHETPLLTLKLNATSDILAGLGNTKKHQILIGFTLDSSNNEALAIDKMHRKKCDIMIFNTVDNALGSDTTEITILDSKGGRKNSGVVTKSAAAKMILEHALHYSGFANG